METRLGRARKAYRLQLLGLPTEIILRCLSFLCYSERDAVVKTCKALRMASATIFYKEICINVQKPKELQLLRARALDPCVAPCCRLLDISVNDLDEPPEQIDSFIPSIVLALRGMSGLTSLSLAPCLLTDEVLEAVRSNSSILSLDLFGAINPRTLPPILRSPPSSSVPPRPLAFVLAAYGSSHPELVSLISRINQAGDVVEKIEIDPASAGFPSFLSPELLPSLRRLEMEVDADADAAVFHWIATIPIQLPSLTKVITNVTSDSGSSFFLSDRFIGLSGDDASARELVEEWSETGVDELVSEHIVNAGCPKIVSLKLSLGNSRIRPSMVVSLAQVVGSLTTLTVGNWLLRNAAMWEDWRATVSAFAAFKSLRSLTLGCSVTPTPTLSTIVGCTIGCVKAAYQRRPALRTDMLLVGGLEGLRKVSTRVNLQRLELLAPHLPVSATVDWILGDEDEPIIYYVGAVEDRHQDGRKTLSFEDVGTRSDHRRSETWMEPNCLLCDKSFDFPSGVDQTTPIDALLDCSVEEVRKALAFEGTDLDAFDSRALTGDETPFELFLRSGSAAKQIEARSQVGEAV